VAECPYCNIAPEDAWIAGENADVILSREPIGAGHVIVAPKRHVSRFYGLDVQEQHSVWELVGLAQKHLSDTLDLNRFSIGFAEFPEDSGEHTHIHVVPRTDGDGISLPPEIQWVDG
jgi:diadenosine tetraphosphate (Ap4A) HIT family hydrolase